MQTKRDVKSSIMAHGSGNLDLTRSQMIIELRMQTSVVLVSSLSFLFNISYQSNTAMSSLLRPLSSSLRLASSRASASSSSTFAQIRFASSVVFIEHKNGKLNDSVLSAITAAQQVGGDVSAIRVAENPPGYKCTSPGGITVRQL